MWIPPNETWCWGHKKTEMATDHFLVPGGPQKNPEMAIDHFRELGGHKKIPKWQQIIFWYWGPQKTQKWQQIIFGNWGPQKNTEMATDHFLVLGATKKPEMAIDHFLVLAHEGWPVVDVWVDLTYNITIHHRWHIVNHHSPKMIENALFCINFF